MPTTTHTSTGAGSQSVILADTSCGDIIDLKADQVLHLWFEVHDESDDNELASLYRSNERLFDDAITTAVREVVGDDTAQFHWIRPGSIEGDFGISPGRRRRFSFQKLKEVIVSAVRKTAQGLRRLGRIALLTIRAGYKVLQVCMALIGALKLGSEIWAGETPFGVNAHRFVEWISNLWRHRGWGIV